MGIVTISSNVSILNFRKINLLGIHYLTKEKSNI